MVLSSPGKVLVVFSFVLSGRVPRYAHLVSTTKLVMRDRYSFSPALLSPSHAMRQRAWKRIRSVSCIYSVDGTCSQRRPLNSQSPPQRSNAGADEELRGQTLPVLYCRGRCQPPMTCSLSQDGQRQCRSLSGLDNRDDLPVFSTNLVLAYRFRR